MDTGGVGVGSTGAGAGVSDAGGSGAVEEEPPQPLTMKLGSSSAPVTRRARRFLPRCAIPAAFGGDSPVTSFMMAPRLPSAVKLISPAGARLETNIHGAHRMLRRLWWKLPSAHIAWHGANSRRRAQPGRQRGRRRTRTSISLGLQSAADFYQPQGFSP